MKAQPHALGLSYRRFAAIFFSAVFLFVLSYWAHTTLFAEALHGTRRVLPAFQTDAIAAARVNDDAFAATRQLLLLLYSLETADPADRDAILNDLRRVAQSRRDLLLAAVRRDPGLVARTNIAAALRARLPAAVQPLLERNVTQRGTLEIYQSEGSPQGTRPAAVTYQLVTQDNARLNLHFADTTPPVSSGAQVQVSGLQLDDELVAAPSGTEVIQGPPLATQATQRKLAVILFNFSDQPTEPYSAAQVRETIFTDTSTNGVNPFYLETTFNQMDWTGALNAEGDVFGWYTLPANSTVCDYFSWAAAANSLAAANGFVLSSYSSIMYVFPPSACEWSGLGTVGVGASARGFAWINGVFDNRIAAHELGHNLGMMHANGYHCEDADGTRVSISDNCISLEYDDPYDVMGYRLFNFSAFHKGESLGRWLAAANTLTLNRTANPSGTYTIVPVEYASTGIMSLRIPRDFDDAGHVTSYYYLDFHQPSLFDNLTLLPDAAPGFSGVTLRLAPDYLVRSTSQLIDTTPATPSYVDAPLQAGASFRDDRKGITIENLEISSAGATVRVTLDPIACNVVMPDLSISPVSGSAYPGDTVTYSLTLTNREDPQCSESTIAVAPIMPSGFIQSPAGFTEHLLPGQSVTRSFLVTLPGSVVSGPYTIAEQATNADNPNVTSSASSMLTVVQHPPFVVISEPADNQMVGAHFRVSTTAFSSIDMSTIRIAVDQTTAGTCTNTKTCSVDLSAVSNGSHAITATATDVEGNQTPRQISVTVCIRAFPVVSMTPSSGTTAQGQSLPYNVTLKNFDSAACPLSTFDVSPTLPSGFSQSPAALTESLAPGASVTRTVSVTSAANAANGTYIFFERAVNRGDATLASSASATFTVFTPDTTPPAVQITTPADNTVVKANFTVTGTASDNVAVTRMRIYLDQALLKTCTNAQNCSTSVAFTNLAKGVHTILADGSDAAGNSASATVKIYNCKRLTPTLTMTPTSATAPPGQAVSYSFTLTNDELTSCPTETYTVTPTLPSGFTQTPAAFTENLAPGGSITRTFLVTSPAGAANGAYNIVAQATNVADTAFTKSATAVLNVFKPDTTAPVVQITSPANGTVVKANFTINAIATDNVGVSSIKILLDQTTLKTCSSVQSCSVAVTFSTLARGAHVITVNGFDAAGNKGTAVANITK